MTTNQTIDGVPRAWLEEYESLADLTSGDAQMLRGLLDAPEPLWNPHAANLAALLIKLAQQGIKVSGGKGDEPWEVEQAAQPQAEQPAPSYRLLGDGDIIQDGDETLNDDTAIWGKVPVGVFIGMPYNRRVMLPVRRATS